MIQIDNCMTAEQMKRQHVRKYEHKWSVPVNSQTSQAAASVFVRVLLSKSFLTKNQAAHKQIYCVTAIYFYTKFFQNILWSILARFPVKHWTYVKVYFHENWRMTCKLSKLLLFLYIKFAYKTVLTFYGTVCEKQL